MVDPKNEMFDSEFQVGRHRSSADLSFGISWAEAELLELSVRGRRVTMASASCTFEARHGEVP